MAKQGFRIIDSDMHVMEPPDLWREHLPAKYRDRAPRISRVPGEDRLTWSFEGRFFPAFTDHPKRAKLNKARFDPEHEKFRRYDDALARRFDAKSQLDAMDEEGIDIAVTFRTIGSHVIAIDDLDPDLEAAIAGAFNRWLAARCAEDPDRLKATAVLPLQNIEHAVAEARHAARELGHVALVLPTNPVRERSWYHEDYDAIWRTACDLGVPVAFHGIQGAYQEHLGNRYLDNLMLMHAAAHPVEQMLCLGGMITGGVFDRFPELRVAYLEGSCGWLSWWLWRLDEEWEKVGHADRVQLAMRPSEYFGRHCFVAVEPDEVVLPDVVDRVGDDCLVISSDWPHDDSGYPHSMDNFLAVEGLSKETQRKVLWDNCARLYDLA